MSSPALVIGDSVTPHGCWPSHVTESGQSNFRVNGIPVCVVGDAIAPHTCPDIPETHAGRCAAGSPTFKVNGKPVYRVGDACSCGGEGASGQNNFRC